MSKYINTKVIVILNTKVNPLNIAVVLWYIEDNNSVYCNNYVQYFLLPIHHHIICCVFSLHT
jgi:hypothetical protein